MIEFTYKKSVEIVVDRTQGLRDEAGYSVALITLVIMLLVGFSISFNSSLNALVVEPLSRIMDKLRTWGRGAGDGRAGGGAHSQPRSTAAHRSRPLPITPPASPVTPSHTSDPIIIATAIVLAPLADLT